MTAIGQIVLKKSSLGGERKFWRPLKRFASGDMRDHIVSSRIEHGLRNAKGVRSHGIDCMFLCFKDPDGTILEYIQFKRRK